MGLFLTVSEYTLNHTDHDRDCQTEDYRNVFTLMIQTYFWQFGWH